MVPAVSSRSLTHVAPAVAVACSQRPCTANSFQAPLVGPTQAALSAYPLLTASTLVPHLRRPGNHENESTVDAIIVHIASCLQPGQDSLDPSQIARRFLCHRNP